jgi:hypothetical protein
VVTLRTLQANKTGPITWKALNVIGRNYGLPAIDFDRFSAQWDSQPELQNIVDRFNEKGIVVNPGDDEGQEMNAPEPTGAVEQMAKRAAKKKRRFD